MEHFGTLLWTLRTSAGWTIGQLARRSGISKAAISRWESGDRQPRIPELEAVMDALDAPAAQRALAFSRIDASRGIRHLRESSDNNTLGAPPVLGDLLKAMRLRGGWTQGEVADRAGVGRTAVVRWENGERLPRGEEIQTLCYVLEAREAELIFLTTGAFSEPDSRRTLPWDEQAAALMEKLHQFSSDQIQVPGDLFYLTQQHKAWLLATEHEGAKPILAETLARYSTELVNHRRWSEAGAVAKRVLLLVPRQEEEPDYMLRAALMHAEASVFGGHQVTPDRGIYELQKWLPHSTSPIYRAWMLSILGKFTMLAGQTDRGVELVSESRNVMDLAGATTETDRVLRQIDYSTALVKANRLEEALHHLPGMKPENGDVFLQEAVARAEIYARLGQILEARDWQQRAYAALKTPNDEQRRPQIKALDRFWDSSGAH
jgi:transcriptional regulator with XRE-family HTH domain